MNGPSRSAEMSTASIFRYIPATAAPVPASLRPPPAVPPPSNASSQQVMESLDLLSDTQQPSASALERFYSNGNPLLSNLQGVEPELEADLLQKMEKRGGDVKRTPMASLRSPLVGDLASPHSQANTDRSSLQLPSKSPAAAHTPTLPSSAAMEVAPSSSLASHSVFPVIQQSEMDSSSAIFLPQSLSELVLPPTSSSPSSSSSGFPLGVSGGEEDTDSGERSATSSDLAMCLWENCQQEFSSLHHLVTHLDRTHTLAMTQFVCLWEGCSRNLKPFDARYKLITHLRCHTGEKPYRCDVVSCKRSFSRLENLKLHTRTHTGEKPYQCDYVGCMKRFNNTSDRAKHKKTHITRKPYVCKYPNCGKSYTDPSSMRKHIKYTHKVKEESERTGLSLVTLPKRKRNSASSSSSSSSTSSTPHTPQHLFLNSPKSLPESASLIQQSPPYGCGVLGGTGSPVTSKPQLIPVVKLQDSPQVLLPSYQQQQPVMMILANSPPTANWVPTSTIATTAQQQQQQQQQQELRQTVKSTGSKVVDVNKTNHPVPAPSSSTTTSSNMEAQLRLQIAHLQQQLYQSQLAAARANQKLVTVTSQPQTEPLSIAEPVRLVGNGKEKVVSHLPLQLPMLSPTLSTAESSPSSLQTFVKTVPMSQATQPAVGGQVLVSSPPGGRGGGQASMLPQYIPIPIIQPQEVTTTQYLYMSP